VYSPVMVIEFLTFNVPLSKQQKWRALDETVWTNFLSTQNGFVKKELWLSHSDSEKFHAVIWWKDKESWKAISEEQIMTVDKQMGDYLIEPELHEFVVIADSQ